jgi:sec-independent protein translocase protein TatA
MNFGAPEIVIVLLLVVLLFGGKKLPELARGLGQGIREFRQSARTPTQEDTNV